MEESKKSNIIIGLLIVIFIAIVGAVVVLAPVNFTHRSTFETVAMTRDGLKININYTVKYKAPLIIPTEMLKDAERKMKIYCTMRLQAFCSQYTGLSFVDRDLKLIQAEFDREDLFGDIIKGLCIPGVSDKLERIKQIKINSIGWHIKGEEPTRKQPIRNELKSAITALKDQRKTFWYLN